MDPQTHKQTHPQTEQDRLQYTAPQLARSVIKKTVVAVDLDVHL